MTPCRRSAKVGRLLLNTVDASRRTRTGREHEGTELRRLDNNGLPFLDYEGGFRFVLLPDLAVVERDDKLAIGLVRKFGDRSMQLLDGFARVLFFSLPLARELPGDAEFVGRRRRHRRWRWYNSGC